MSIASEVTRLQNAKADLKTAIMAKGVEVADTDTIDTYASKVDEIESGGNYDEGYKDGHEAGYTEGNAEGEEYKKLYDKLLNKETEEITISQHWTTVPDYAFVNFQKLSKVDFHSNIKHIGYQAFYWCTNLTKLELPADNPLSLSQQAFCYTGIETLSLPPNITSMAYATFGNCYNLKKIIVEAVSTNLHTNAFLNSPNIEEVVLPTGFNNHQLNVSFSNKLTIESMVAMFEALADLTGQSAKHLVIGATNLAKLTAEQIAIATNKNWTLA